MSRYSQPYNTVSDRYTEVRSTGRSSATPGEYISEPTDRSKHRYKTTTNVELRTIFPEDEHESAIEYERASLAPASAIDGFDNDTLGRPLLWSPAVLHWTSLVAFGTLFAVILAALEILNHFSRKNNGLVQAEEKDYYLWTYGPTAGTVGTGNQSTRPLILLLSPQPYRSPMGIGRIPREAAQALASVEERSLRCLYIGSSRLRLALERHRAF